jgi:hypothetical protein
MQRADQAKRLDMTDGHNMETQNSVIWGIAVLITISATGVNLP